MLVLIDDAVLFYSPTVLRFFRFKDPPQPHESLEASQTYCEDLEQSVVELKRSCRELEDEILTLKNDLDHSFHSQQEAQGLATHFQTQYSYQGSEMQVSQRTTSPLSGIALSPSHLKLSGIA